jgi:hypothetical protein
MKAFLMFPDRDFDPRIELIQIAVPFPRRDRPFDPWAALPWQARVLCDDLQLEPVLRAMARDDALLYEVARRALLSSVEQDSATIRHRQAILADFIVHPGVLHGIYRLVVEANEAARKTAGWLNALSPSGALGSAIGSMEVFVQALRRLRAIAEDEAPRVTSQGMLRFFAMLTDQLGDAYFAEIEDHLKRLRFRHGVPVSAGIGGGCKGRDYTLRMPASDSPGWLNWLFGPHEEGYTLTLAPRDEAGATALGELRERGLAQVAQALRRSAGHIHDFFDMIRIELAFYIGCLNLRDRLIEIGEPCTLPGWSESTSRALAFDDLYDIALALQVGRKVAGNGVDARDADLIVVTGANRGGKTTFLRSLGQAQLMLQAGMFVGASAFRSNLAAGIFTHFKREEDRTMESGKLDEELARMSGIVDHLRPDALVLFNESFASTNEREGSELAQQVTGALRERRVKMVHVTHLFAFSNGLRRTTPAPFFLRAEPERDGTMAFRLHEGEPRATSFGEDVYRRYFAA